MSSRATVAGLSSSSRPKEDAVSAPDTAIDQLAARIGSRIRALRQARGLTLVQLAATADLSHPFLSQLERGRARPSMTSLEKIARALGTSQLELLAAMDDADDEPGQSDVVLVRAGEGSHGHYGEGEARLLVYGRRPFHPMEVRGANLVAGDFFTHDEDEFLHVLDGTVVVELLPEGPYVLKVGDSLYYVGGTPHRWSALDATGYRLFVVKEKPNRL